jgi:hypothetical protein
MMSDEFNVGDHVQVTRAYPPGHIRTPAFLRGQRGVILRHFGRFGNPERLAYGMNGLPKLNLYQVQFQMADIWPGEKDYGPKDSVTADIFEHWLEPVAQESLSDE